MDKTEIAKKFLDAIIYDNDFVNRWTPFDEAKHYDEWVKKVEDAISFPDGDEEFWTDDNIDLMAIGDYDLILQLIEKFPELESLDKILNDYMEYLETLPWKCHD